MTSIWPMNEREIERFVEKVAAPDANGCTLWTANQDGRGYGSFSLKRNGKWRSFKAHRVGFAVAKQADPPRGLQLDHVCRVRLCVAADHLEPVSNRTNTLRGVGALAVNAAKTHCAHGHALDGENVRWRTTRYGTVGRGCRTCAIASQRAAADRRRTARLVSCDRCDAAFASARDMRVHRARIHGISLADDTAAALRATSVPMTDAELADVVGTSTGSMQYARAQLVATGVAVLHGETTSPTGRAVKLWRLRAWEVDR